MAFGDTLLNSCVTRVGKMAQMHELDIEEVISLDLYLRSKKVVIFILLIIRKLGLYLRLEKPRDEMCPTSLFSFSFSSRAFEP